jgi:dihydrofolate synthase / folylpolyglutamate synthase
VNRFQADQEKAISKWLFSRLGSEEFRPGLERLRTHFQKFKNKLINEGTKVVTIAGTNGKGQTAFILQELLLSQGHSVSTWSSPHILSIRERFNLNGTIISYEHLNKAIERNFSLADSLSYYEFLFLIFCDVVCERPPQFLILEVGLGGRFDAVNIFDAEMTAVTSLSRDHQKILGNRFDQILYEKLGVTRSGKKLYTCLEQKYLREKTEKFCHKSEVEWIDLFEIKQVSNKTDYRKRNYKLAHSMAVDLISKKITCDFNMADSPQIGRWEKVTLGGISFIFIGAHNLDGFRKMTQALCKDREVHAGKKINQVLVSFSDRPRKEVKECLNILSDTRLLFDSLILTYFEHERAMPKKAVEGLALVEGKIKFVPNWKQEIYNWQDSGNNVLVTGSYYFIGEVQKYIYSNIHTRNDV